MTPIHRLLITFFATLGLACCGGNSTSKDVTQRAAIEDVYARSSFVTEHARYLFL